MVADARQRVHLEALGQGLGVQDVVYSAARHVEVHVAVEATRTTQMESLSEC